jgi:hypothetical protein
MYQRILLDFRQYADAELLAFAQTILTRMTETADFEPLRDFTETDVKPALDAYEAAMAAAFDGGRTRIAAKQTRKAVLVDKITLLALRVQTLVTDNRELLLNSGFVPREGRGPTRRNSIDGVNGLIAATGPLAGTAVVAFSPVRQARMYVVEFSVDQKTWLNSAYPSAARFVLEGLTSKAENYIRVRALGTDMRKGPWSETAAVYVK